MPRIRNPYTGDTITVSSAVRVGPRGSARWESYCGRSARIRGGWKRNPNAKNLVQRRRWKCPYVAGELRITEYKRR